MKKTNKSLMPLFPKRKSFSHYVGCISQYLLVALFLFTGFVKAVDPIGTALKVSDYLTAFGIGGWRWFSFSCAVLLIGVEFILGVLLLMGMYQRFTRWAVLFFMSAMTLLTLYVLLFNPVSDCGCFGDFFKVSNQVTFLKNLFFMVPTFLLFLEKRDWRPAFIHRSIQNTLFLLGLFGIGFFIQQNARHLPLFDFRPFRIGSSFANLVLRPEGAAEDVYSYQFVYEREGEEKVFEVDSLPDSTWQYKDTRITLVSEGYHPPVENFTLLHNFEDVTSEVVGSNEYNMIWILAPRWEYIHKETIESINRLYQYAFNNGILFYGISGSDEQEVARWKERSSAKYPLLLLDATTIQTIARGNPSVLFLKKGIIHTKMNALDLKKRNVEKQVEAIFSSKKTISQNPLPRMVPLSLWLLLTLVGLFITPGRTR